MSIAVTAVDAAGRIYVTDASRQAVFVFDPVAGKLDVWEKAEGLANFSTPVALAVTQGLTYVTDAELGIVARLDPTGTPQRALGRGLLKRPTGLAFDAERGELYVSDTAAHDIKVLDLSGTLKRVLGRRGEGDGEFNFPTHLAFAEDPSSTHKPTGPYLAGRPARAPRPTGRRTT